MITGNQLTDSQLKKIEALQNNLPYYARNTLKIKDKSGNIIPFHFNRAQKFIHTKLEEQKSLIGRVRALIVKGRQQGCSTYTAARFYQKTSLRKGQSTFILSHEAQTTQKLFAIVDRFFHNTPNTLRPPLSISNRNRMKFGKMDSDYTVGTAGNQDTGRGGTLQLFHGSEVHWWEHTDNIKSGIMQSVAELDGTEIILESTGNGMAGMFYEMCMAALEGKGAYILIFVPWWWQDEYESDVPAGFVMTPEEEMYLNTNLGEFPLTKALRKIVWRRGKIVELKSEWLFKQEYPANVQEAFQTSSKSLCKAESIARARKCKNTDQHAPRILGVDCARKGDRSVIAYRQGKQLITYWKYSDMNEMLFAGIIGTKLRELEIDKCFIDVALGYGTYDRLVELGWGRVVVPVPFGSGAIEDTVYLNKRAEMAILFRDWLNLPDTNIPDDDELHVDIAIIPDFKHTSNGRIKLVPKEEIRDKLKKSPDIFDAVILTFAYPVTNEKMIHQMRHAAHASKRGVRNPKRGLRTLRRMRGERHLSPSAAGEEMILNIH